MVESWQDDIDHIEFKDFLFKKSIGLDEVKFEKLIKFKLYLFISRCFLGEIKDDEGNIIKQHKDKWNPIFDQRIDLIIKDEDHYGYETESLKTSYLN